MNKNPEVSLVIRTKNEGKFIGRVLKYIQRQTFKNFEIIIVDSGSTDGTLEIVKKFPVNLIKIKPERFSFGRALNIGIEASKGKYICILSGHSIPISDTWLKEGLLVLKEKNVAAISGYYSESRVGYFSRLIGSLAFIRHKEREDFTPWMSNSNVIIRKDLWRKYNFDEKLEGSEDYDWGKEMVSRGYNVVKYKPFSVFHSHFLLGRPGYKEMLLKWKEWNSIVDKKRR